MKQDYSSNIQHTRHESITYTYNALIIPFSEGNTVLKIFGLIWMPAVEIPFLVVPNHLFMMMSSELLNCNRNIERLVRLNCDNGCVWANHSWLIWPHLGVLLMETCTRSGQCYYIFMISDIKVLLSFAFISIKGGWDKTIYHWNNLMIIRPGVTAAELGWLSLNPVIFSYLRLAFVMIWFIKLYG